MDVQWGVPLTPSELLFALRKALLEWDRAARDIAAQKHTMTMVARTLCGMGGEHHRTHILRRTLYKLKSAAMAADLSL